jgi:predicted permease
MRTDSQCRSSVVLCVLQIVYNIFLPCLLLTSVAKTAASQPLRTLVALPISAWLQIGIGFMVARVTMAALKIDPETEAGREVKVLYTLME